MTLRRRILLGVLVLVAAGLLIADAATAATLRSFLLERVDRQVLGARQAIVRRVSSSSANPVSGPSSAAGAAPAGFGGRELGPSEFFVEILDPNGKPLLSLPATLRAEHDPPPRISHALIQRASAPNTSHVGPITVGAETGSTRYRVVLSHSPGSSEIVVAAVSLRELDTTFGRLVLVEAGVGLAVLAGIAILALWVVRLGFRPLHDMAVTAGDISAGDLSRRVPESNAGDEVGQLAAALNAMLTQIEAAFTERADSEDRLRRFVADASHELRTPLTSIRGYAELYRHGAAEGGDLQPLMRSIEEQAARMGVLVDDLLLLARLDQHRPLERRPVQLVALATDAVADAHAADPSRPLQLHAKDDPVVAGDPHRLRQVLDNLLANASVHTPPDTPVVVEISARSNQAVMTVRDEGPGMSEEVANRVFERFYRADPSRARDRGGSGLGLSIVRAVVEAHGGQATVRSVLGEGTTVTVTLPLDPPEPDKTPGSAHTELSGPGQDRPSRSWSTERLTPTPPSFVRLSRCISFVAPSWPLSSACPSWS